jgi:two-component system chemotaxis response regulator CheB
MEPDLATENIALREADRPGRMSVYSCPDCHGTLWETDEDGILRFRCRIGHAYSADTMVPAQTDSVDRALSIALRSLEERAALTQRMAERARRRGQPRVARAFASRAHDAEDQAGVLRALINTRSAGHVVPDRSSDAEIPETRSPEPPGE